MPLKSFIGAKHKIRYLFGPLPADGPDQDREFRGCWFAEINDLGNVVVWATAFRT